jgi:hypothetical protein
VAVVSQIAAEPWVNGHKEAVRRLFAVGLGTAWRFLRPYADLSSGERARADVARALKHGACIDDFASAVDRVTARAIAIGAARYVRESRLWGVVFASCHDDVTEWLRPNWILDAGSGRIAIVDSDWPEPPAPHAVWAGGRPADKGAVPVDLVRTRDLAGRQLQALLPRRSMPGASAPAAGAWDSPLRPVTVWTLDIERAHFEVYEDIFPDLHYKTAPINKSARVYVATLRECGGIPVGLIALLAQTGGRMRPLRIPFRMRA